MSCITVLCKDLFFFTIVSSSDSLAALCQACWTDLSGVNINQRRRLPPLLGPCKYTQAVKKCLFLKLLGKLQSTGKPESL